MTARKTRIDFSAITDENSNAFNDSVAAILNNPTEDQSNRVSAGSQEPLKNLESKPLDLENLEKGNIF